MFPRELNHRTVPCTWRSCINFSPRLIESCRRTWTNGAKNRSNYVIPSWQDNWYAPGSSFNSQLQRTRVSKCSFLSFTGKKSGFMQMKSLLFFFIVRMSSAEASTLTAFVLLVFFLLGLGDTRHKKSLLQKCVIHALVTSLFPNQFVFAVLFWQFSCFSFVVSQIMFLPVRVKDGLSCDREIWGLPGTRHRKRWVLADALSCDMCSWHTNACLERITFTHFWWDYQTAQIGMYPKAWVYFGSKMWTTLTSTTTNNRILERNQKGNLFRFVCCFSFH